MPRATCVLSTACYLSVHLLVLLYTTGVTKQFQSLIFLANDEQLFNSDCYLRLLVNSIMSRCSSEDCVEGKQYYEPHDWGAYCIIPILADHDRLALVDEAEYSIIELAQFSQSLDNGRSVFTGRGSYVLVAIDSKCSMSPTVTLYDVCDDIGEKWRSQCRVCVCTCVRLCVCMCVCMWERERERERETKREDR